MATEVSISNMTTDEIIEHFRAFFHGVEMMLTNEVECIKNNAVGWEDKSPLAGMEYCAKMGVTACHRGLILADELEDAFKKNNHLLSNGK